VRRDDQAADGGAEHRGQLPGGDVHRQGAGELLARHQVGDERLAGRQAEGVGGGRKRGDDVDHPERRLVQAGAGGEYERADEHRHLGDDHQLAPVEGVGKHAAAKGQQHQGDEPGGADHAQGQLAARQLVDLPADGGAAHLGAGQGNQVAQPEQGEVPRAEGGQRRLLRHGCWTRQLFRTMGVVYLRQGFGR